MRSRRVRPAVRQARAVTRALAAAVACLVVLTPLAGCSGNSASGGEEGDTTLTVFAASSLTEAFDELGKRFESDHPGVSVRFSFDSSATLAEQVAQGAPADVLATADTRTMQTVVDAGANDGQPQVFATNRLVLVVPKDNPAGIAQFSDLESPDVSYVMCVVSAPCGDLAETVLEASGITAEPRSEEVDVKSVLSKVELGEADAGLVYTTDAKAADGDVRALPIPGSAGYVNDYPIVVLAGAESSDLARDWVDLVVSPEGQEALGDAGFGKP